MNTTRSSHRMEPTGRRTLLQDIELVPQHQDLSLQPRSWPEPVAQHADQRPTRGRLQSFADHVPIRRCPRVKWMEFSEATGRACIANHGLRVHARMAERRGAPHTPSAHGLHVTFDRLGFGEVVQFLEIRGVESLLEPCDGATSKGSDKNAMIECQASKNIAVRIGWPVAQEGRLLRSRCAEAGPPPGR